MAYEDDRNMELDRQLYEEDPAYEADTYFGERLNEPISDGSSLEADEYEEEDLDSTGGFGESLSPSADEMETEPAAQESDKAPDKAEKQDKEL